jgi:hypothetical protein
MIPSITHQLSILEHIKEIEDMLGQYERHPGNRIDRLYNACGSKEMILEILESSD